MKGKLEKILLLGATGRTGRFIPDLAIDKGYEVNCLVRNPDKVKKQPGMTVFTGDVKSLADLRNASEGCQAIINLLNISRKSDFPWSPLRTPPDFLSEVMTKTILVAKEKAIDRIVSCSAWGVADSESEIPFWFRWLINVSNIKAAYKEHQAQEALIRRSGLCWTIIRPTGLTNGRKKQQILESFGGNPNPNLMISRVSVAEYMINCLAEPKLFRNTVTISSV
ncbi:MAG: NAD(P)-binding oxidoreductase [Cyclobacteriaceae bacterium]